MEHLCVGSPATQVVAAGIPVSLDVFMAPVCRALSREAVAAVLDKTMDAYAAYLATFNASLRACSDVDVESESVGVLADPPTVAELSDTESVSVRSSASSGRARRRAAKRARDAKERASVKSDVTYTDDVGVPTSDGFCYLRMIKVEEAVAVQNELGSEPTFERILELSASVLVGDWRMLKVSGNRGVYHVAVTGMVDLAMCLASVAASRRWMPGTVGDLVLGLRLNLPKVLVEKAPALTDVLAGVSDTFASAGSVKPVRVEVVHAGGLALSGQALVTSMLEDVQEVRRGNDVQASWLPAEHDYGQEATYVAVSAIFGKKAYRAMAPVQSRVAVRDMARKLGMDYVSTTTQVVSGSLLEVSRYKSADGVCNVGCIRHCSESSSSSVLDHVDPARRVMEVIATGKHGSHMQTVGVDYTAPFSSLVCVWRQSEDPKW